MEDVFTIKVKTKPDKANVYPSERRYSASTVSGLAWIHIALAVTCFLLSCLTLVNTNSEPVQRLNIEETTQKTVDNDELINNLPIETTTVDYINENFTETVKNSVEETKNYDNNYLLVVAPCLVCIFALTSGIAAINASIRWYIDKNITWLFIISVLSAVTSFISVILIIVWLSEQPERNSTHEEALKGFFGTNNYAVIHKNTSHILLVQNSTESEGKRTNTFTNKVLSINILIAALLEFLWSLLSVKISYKGMMSDYKNNDLEDKGNHVSVVTKIKGNNIKHLKTSKLHSNPDIIGHHPNKNINRIFLANGNNGFYLRNEKEPNTNTSEEMYNDRINNYLKRRNSAELSEPSVQTESTTPQENVRGKQNSTQNKPEIVEQSPDLTKIGWGDTLERTVYNQNNINFDAIFKNYIKKNNNGTDNQKKSGRQSENREI